MAGKCPKCGNAVLNATISKVNLSGLGMLALNGISYSCPNIACQTVLSVGVDPIALKTDTINGVVKALRGKV
jgi:hypothetical protein